MQGNISIEEILEQKRIEYQQILKKENPETIQKVLHILQSKRREPRKFIDMSDEDIRRIFELMKRYQEDIKQIFLENGVALKHITNISPENVVGGHIRKSKNRLNNYETEVGDWVFASSSPIGDNNPYIARKPKDGMINIGHYAYIMGGDNIDIQLDEHGDKHAVLKEPNYVYKINPQNFLPVVTLKTDKNGEPYFEFSEEWISQEDVDINDPRQVIGVEKIVDITNLLNQYQILCDINHQGIGRQIHSIGNVEQIIQTILSKIQDGSLRYINDEAGININPIFIRKKEKKISNPNDGR